MSSEEALTALKELAEGVKQPYLWPRHVKALRVAVSLLEDVQRREVRAMPPYIEDPRCPHCHGTGLN